MHVNELIWRFVSRVRSFARLRLHSFSADENLPIDQQTSAEAGLSAHTFQSDDVILGGYRDMKEPVGPYIKSVIYSSRFIYLTGYIPILGFCGDNLDWYDIVHKII
jgi:hypothetical protein